MKPPTSGVWRSAARRSNEQPPTSPACAILRRARGAAAHAARARLLRHEAASLRIYATPLKVLLAHLGARKLILTGVSSHQCALFTANDAHVRNFQLVVPNDCIGAALAVSIQENVQPHCEFLSIELAAMDCITTVLRPPFMRKLSG